MDERTGELHELPSEGPALSNNELVYIRDERDEAGVVHRVDITYGSGHFNNQKYTTHCRLTIPVRETLWTADKPSCVGCIAAGDPDQ